MIFSSGEATAAGSRRCFLGRVTDISCLASNRVGLTDGHHLVTRSSQEMCDNVGVLFGNSDVFWTPVLCDFSLLLLQLERSS